MGLGENQDLLPDPLLDGQIKLQNRLIRLYGIFQQCSQLCVGIGFLHGFLGLVKRDIQTGQPLGVWGVVNLLEGYGNDNPGAKSQGIKQLMAGAGIMALGTTLIPQLSSLF